MKYLQNTIKVTSTQVLISTMIDTLSEMSKAVLNVMIQEELEQRIGENRVDEILDANR